MHRTYGRVVQSASRLTARLEDLRSVVGAAAHIAWIEPTYAAGEATQYPLKKLPTGSPAIATGQSAYSRDLRSLTARYDGGFMRWRGSTSVDWLSRRLGW